MNLTENEALELAKKVMHDINFNYDQKAEILVKFNEKGKFENYDMWLVGFQYGLEDFGRYIRGYVSINDETKKIDKTITIRNGSITLGYNEEKDKYFIKEKRP